MRATMAGLGTIGIVCLLSLVLSPEPPPAFLVATYAAAFVAGVIIDTVGRLIYRQINKPKAI